MFIELWQGVRDLMHDNNTDTAVANAKRFVNWTLQDLGNRYDWEFLKGTLQLTASAGSGLYVIDPIAQITATGTTLYVYSDATADGGSTVKLLGKQIPGSNADVIQSCDVVTIIGTATATGGVGFSHLDSIQRATGSGTVYVVTSAGGVVASLGASTTYLANDIKQIDKVVDQTNNKIITRYDYSDYQKGNPNDTNLTSDEAYDIDFNGQIRLMNVASGLSVLILYQRSPRYLINDIDRTEFPRFLYQKIINASWNGYGKRYQDEQDGTVGESIYTQLLDDIVSDYKMLGEKKGKRILPNWIRRTL